MRKLIITAALIMLSGCAQIKGLVPSFWDANQSARIVDLAVQAEQIRCSEPQRPQALAMQHNVLWFKIYSETKGWRQQDVIKLTEPIAATVNDWVKRTDAQKDNPVYCEIKRKILIEQTKRAAEAVQGRF